MLVAHYVRAVRAHWLTVLLLVVVGGAGAGIIAWRQTPQYKADTQLFIAVTGPTADLGQLSQAGTFAQQQVRSFTNIVRSPLVLTQVISTLNLPYTTEELSRRISVSSPLDTVLLDISVTDPSPQRARDIANAIGTTFAQFVTTIETPPGADSSPLTATVTTPALLPLTPESPRPLLELVLGLLIGLIAGTGVAAARQALDRTIGSTRQLARIADVAVLGEVGDGAATSDKPLIAADSRSPQTEAFRRLRTNIQFHSIDRRLSSLVVTSALAGEGKSTVATNLAIALAQAGDPVVIVDGDLRMPRLAATFGLPGNLGLTSILLGEANADLAMQRWSVDLPLFVITAGPLPSNPSELLGSRTLLEMIGYLESKGMTVIFDSPPLLPVTDAAILARQTQGALLVTEVGSTRSDELEAALASLKAIHAPILGVVANRVRRSWGEHLVDDYDRRQAGAQATPASAAPRAAKPEVAAGARSAAPAVSGGYAMPTQTTQAVGGREATTTES